MKTFRKVQDFLTTLRGTWFLQLLNLIAVYAFIFSAAGQDVLLVIAENTGNGQGLLQLAVFEAALLLWMYASAFGTSVLIRLTDNSGYSLDPVRVRNRQRYQSKIPKLALFFPPLLMLCAFIWVYIINFSSLKKSGDLVDLSYLTYGLIVLIVIFGADLFMGWRYLRSGNLFNPLSFTQWEQTLNGMFEDIRVDIPLSCKDGWANYLIASGGGTGQRAELKRGVKLPNGMTLPASDHFKLISVKNDPGNQIETWMYRTSYRLYGGTLKRLRLVTLASVTLILVLGFLFPVGLCAKVGAVSLICFSFGTWISIYVLFHFIDKAQPFPVRFTLLVWLIICSVINQDHPVRLSGDPQKRPTLQEHFKAWLSATAADTASSAYYRVGKDSLPVIFVSAEGGALRTGAFTGLVMARLQDSFPQFSHYLYAYSSVSGGTVGANFFNAQVMHYQANHSPTDTTWHIHSKLFFKSDFLSGLTAKLAFSEIVNYFWPWHLASADRAIALEKSFELGFKTAYPGDDNYLSGNFNQTIAPRLPAIFINTTEAETGLQAIWSNVQLDSIPLNTKRDLYAIQGSSMRYSSAINLSDRFPLISPAGSFTRMNKDGSTFRRHFVDGGYYENKGSESLLQVLKALPLRGRKIKPYILQFNFTGDTTIHSITKFNEITEILGAIYNTRSGRGHIAEDALKSYVDSLHGVFIPLNLTLNTRELPLNWVLSSTIVDKLDASLRQLVNRADTGQTFTSEDKNQLHRLFFYHPECRYKGHAAGR